MMMRLCGGRMMEQCRQPVRCRLTARFLWACWLVERNEESLMDLKTLMRLLSARDASHMS